MAAAIKLTPAIFVVYLLLVGKRRAFWVAVGTGLLVTLASAAVVPSASYEFWSRLVRGDTGLGGSIIYYTNQSVMADVVRIFGLGPGGGGGRTGRLRPGGARRVVGRRALAPAG